MSIDLYTRIVSKRSTTPSEVPTIPPSDDHTDGSWSSTDIYKGELFINLADGKAYTRTDSGIVDILVTSDVVGVLDFKGGYDAATNTPDLDVAPSGVEKGDVYVVTVAGKFFGTEELEVGDMLFAEKDGAAALIDWVIVNNNITTGALAGQHQINGVDLNASEPVVTNGSKEFRTVPLGTAFNKEFGASAGTVVEIGGAGLTGSEIVQTNASSKLITQPINTAHNKNFGLAAGTVMEGNADSDDIPNASTVSGVTISDALETLAGQGLATKSGVELNAAFAGNPKKVTVTFGTAFADANYSPVIVCETVSDAAFTPVVESVAAGSFVINMTVNNITNLTAVRWTATKHGETT